MRIRSNNAFDSRYNLGTNNLNPLGAQESFEAGQIAAGRYASLANDSSVVPFVRTDSSQRVIDSAGNWTAGFVYNTTVVRPSVALVISGATWVGSPLRSRQFKLILSWATEQ